MSMLLIETKLGLYRSTVNAESVKALASATSQFHILLATVGVDREGNLKVHACDKLGIGELPYVDMVAGDDTRESLDVLSNLRDADVFGGSLEKNARSAPGKRDTGLEDNGSNEQGDSRIGVDLTRPVGKPDDKSSDHDTNVTKHITNDVKDHGVHAHVSMVVAMAVLLASLLGESMVVAVVDT